MARLVFSPRAEADLEEIGDYIARDNPARALTFLDELREHCSAIVNAPRMYALRAELGTGIRIAVHGRYLILFRADDETGRIERIVHGVRHRPSRP
ncbi:MAG: type II toxin-antitoxin system RelE/ParE family toxin [Alphaproteobacteria bacterium]